MDCELVTTQAGNPDAFKSGNNSRLEYIGITTIVLAAHALGLRLHPLMRVFLSDDGNTR